MTPIDNATGSTVEALSDGAALPSRLPRRAFLPLLGGAVISALAYGASFMLPDALVAASLPGASAGSMIGSGTVATLAGALFAGRVAQRLGLMTPIIVASAIMGVALACFVQIPTIPDGYSDLKPDTVPTRSRTVLRFEAGRDEGAPAGR